MCRYAGHNYRSHFACFACRKAFKPWRRDRRSRTSEPEVDLAPREAACPECGRPMSLMGLDFKAPPRRDRGAWEVLRLLRADGFAFNGCGCGVGYVPPRNLRDVPRWLEAHRRPTGWEKLLAKFSARRG